MRQDHQERQEPSSEADALALVVVDAGLKVHRALGPGLLESIYEACLEREARLRGLSVKRQVALAVVYEGLRLEDGYRQDLLVEDQVVVEVKAVDTLTALHQAQLMTYLRLAGCRLGLPMNFNTVLFKQGLRRVIV